MMQPQNRTQVSYRKRRTLPLHSAAWKRLRAQVLAEEPLCGDCTARELVTRATEVDHIKDSREDYTDDNRRENLRGLCKPCHSVRTSMSMGKASTLGCNVRGVPLDDYHHWNR